MLDSSQLCPAIFCVRSPHAIPVDSKKGVLGYIELPEWYSVWPIGTVQSRTEVERDMAAKLIALAVLAIVAAATFAIFWLIELRNSRARILKGLAGKLRILLA
jgi:hypothetical protein